jgi:hypothetical protein
MAVYQSSHSGKQIDTAVSTALKVPETFGETGQILRVNSDASGFEFESAGAVAENDTRLVTGDTVYAFIKALDANNVSY